MFRIEKYIPDPPKPPMEEFTVPPGIYFFLHKGNEKLGATRFLCISMRENDFDYFRVTCLDGEVHIVNHTKLVVYPYDMYECFNGIDSSIISKDIFMIALDNAIKLLQP